MKPRRSVFRSEWLIKDSGVDGKKWKVNPKCDEKYVRFVKRLCFKKKISGEDE